MRSCPRVGVISKRKSWTKFEVVTNIVEGEGVHRNILLEGQIKDTLWNGILSQLKNARVGKHAGRKQRNDLFTEDKAPENHRQSH